MIAFEPEQDFELALCLAPGLGGAGISKILARNAVTGVGRSKFLSLSADCLIEEYGLSAKTAAALSNGAESLREQVRHFKERTAGKSVRVLTLQDSTYPRRVEEFCKKPPGFFFAYGNLKILNSQTFCCLASRNPPREALDLMEKSVEEAVLDSKVLITSANTPAYQRSAVIPLRWGAPRTLVLDRGIFQAFGDGLDREPFPAARLWRYRFDPETDLVLSPFRPDDPFIGVNNKIRDEIVVALSDEVYVTHMQPGGNVATLSTQASGLGRSVTYLSS